MQDPALRRWVNRAGAASDTLRFWGRFVVPQGQPRAFGLDPLDLRHELYPVRLLHRLLPGGFVVAGLHDHPARHGFVRGEAYQLERPGAAAVACELHVRTFLLV